MLLIILAYPSQAATFGKLQPMILALPMTIIGCEPNEVRVDSHSLVALLSCSDYQILVAQQSPIRSTEDHRKTDEALVSVELQGFALVTSCAASSFVLAHMSSGDLTTFNCYTFYSRRTPRNLVVAHVGDRSTVAILHLD